MPVPPRDVEPTRPLIDARLRSWAHDLHPAAAVNGLAALAEAAGRTEAAFDLLHRFWRDVIGSDRTGPDFERFRCLHGRLGMGQGLLSLAEDLDSDAGMESLQNLLRLHADGSSTAGAWAALTFMWAGRVAEGFPFLGSTTELVMHRIEHPTDEAVDARSEIDGWLALAEALYILGEAEPLLETWRSYVELADRDGDLPRQALVTAMAAFVVAEFDPESYPELRDGLVAAVMEAAHRLHLPAVRGFVELAEARYWTKLIEGQRAVEHFDAAVQAMTEAARMTWRGFALVQHAKALLDTGDHERADEQLDEAFPLVDRFPALGVWFGEARGQWNRALGHEEFARRNFEAAVSRAEEMGMPRRAEHLGRYLT
jgi:tetratricopeptide (TPR) repeat protein